MSEKNTIPPASNGVHPPEKIKPVWANIIIMLYLHVSAVYGIYLAVFHAKIYTVIFGKHVRIMKTNFLIIPCSQLFCYTN